MQKIGLVFLLLLQQTLLHAGMVSGYVRDEQGKPLPYASVYVKNGQQGTTSGVNGFFQLNLPEGKLTLVAQHVGYTRQEQEIIVQAAAMQLSFTLVLQQASLKEVVVKPGAEDPAYEIIRNAIRKRKEHLEELSGFQCMVYTKEQLQLRDFPTKFFGQKVDFEDGDTSKRKILYLSETVSRYSVKEAGLDKLEVLSTRVSGNSNSFGLSLPRIINFYQNSIVVQGLNQRGFISPIANNALYYYRYQYEGSFWEEGREINRIKVIPKRKYEPVFSGTIFITENDWRIHSLQLELLKTSQMEILDTLQVEQLYAPYDTRQWVIRKQVLYPTVKRFGFDVIGSSVTVYSDFDLEPEFAPKHFNNIVMKYNEGSNRKSVGYWDSIRPLPLQPEEILDYRRKDSLEQARKDPRYLDSLDRIRNKVSPVALLLTGENFSIQKKRVTISVNPVIQSVSFNTIEGLAIAASGVWTKRLDSLNTGRSISIKPTFRYGFSNGHLNARVQGVYNFGTRNPSSLSFGGGKYIFQFNNEAPVGPLVNSFATLWRELNYMKLYEAWYGKMQYRKELNNGFVVMGGMQYQDRWSVNNSTDYKWRNLKDREYTPNLPGNLLLAPMEALQAFTTELNITWKPGLRFVEFPDRKLNLGSKYPSMSVGLTKGWKGILGSDVDYLKWETGIRDDLNLKIGGLFQYSVAVGGFLQRDAVQVPDFKHFNGNQLLFATPYMTSFQGLPYYKFSNASRLWMEGHVEHHLNGLLTNKIPGFRQLNWFLVGGVNALWLDGNRHYGEVLLGLENILKIMRVDMVFTFDQGRFAGTYGRLSIRGFSFGATD
ncbi:DUF5686 and carboxypeptidase regulatory-like domain-containing protein [Flavihumibacter sp. RY-1]|uniref:DUF5686 and carboxypeptidase regulatory-like domain-containing protein n=1 Tax=Flavihumibacter fluminis TaxID=2909236 RepID=A0ABS9BGW4_9BACT|nr:DUF5686 and carboxypeptidase regulatory-like domain-containing protein [Flavihumibacter fluminis]MCF1714942.1 DUF5686 and carboxypeptidase regulatory-like domain-containing protein [Flavihumibacter fluminis]